MMHQACSRASLHLSGGLDQMPTSNQVTDNLSNQWWDPVIDTELGLIAVQRPGPSAQ
jgi:hypothetical protein